MTDLEFLEEEKRALERLNPKRLGTGSYVQSGHGYDWTGDGLPTCCALGAYFLAKDKGRISRDEFYARYQNGLDMSTYNLPDNGRAIDTVNEKFRPGDNSVRAQLLRWQHVYRWVCKAIKKCKNEAK